MSMIPFGDTCKLQNGRAFKPSEWCEAGTPIVRIQNLNNETKPFNYCDFEVEKRFHINSGDLLFSWSGTPGTSFGAFFWNRGKGFLNQHIFRVDVDEERFDKNYIRYAINSKLNLIIDQAHGGVGLKHITKGKLEAIEIPGCPLKEQKRIAAILDKADAIRRKRQQAIDLTDQLLRSVFLDMFGDPVTNPKGWVKERFDDLGVWASGGTPARKQKKYFMGDIDWYSAGELNTRYVESSIEKITESAINESAAKIFKSGSILLGMYDTAAFKQSILKADSASNQACANLFPNEKLSVEWFYTYISISKEHYLRLRRGVRQKNLNLGMIKEFELPLPPKEKQLEFEMVCQKILNAESSNHEYNKSTELLFSSLTQQAFNGQLSQAT